MNSKAKPDPAHGGAPYIGGEGCNGPSGLDPGMEGLSEGYEAGDEGLYMLIRPYDIAQNPSLHAVKWLMDIINFFNKPDSQPKNVKTK